MKNQETLKRYKDLKLKLKELSENYFSLSVDFQKELIEHCLSSDFSLSLLLKKDSLASYESQLLSELDSSKKWLSSLNFNFKECSLEQLQDDYGLEQAQVESPNFEEETFRFEKLHLGEESRTYVEKLFDDKQELNHHFIQEASRKEKATLEKRIKEVQELFPNGIEKLPENKALGKLSDADIILFFKHKYLSLIDDFPIFFLRENTTQKISLIIRFYQETILKISVEEFASQYSIESLYAIGLQSIARYCNYSWNRVLDLAYPSRFLPWQYGKVDDGYWENLEHRKKAIRWIIEDYFNIKEDKIWSLSRSKKYKRQLFGKLGLSYLYNSYYNSILKPLEESYPHLDYWHFGIFPDKYWNRHDAKKNATRAFKWLLKEESISLEDLPLAIKEKRLSRKSFSEYNLSTMFDYCFSKNLFEIVNESFPNYFKPWEIGKVKKGYWDNKEKQKEAIDWFIEESQLQENEILRSVERNTFQKKSFVDSKLAHFFKSIFNNDPKKVFGALLFKQQRIQVENMRITKLLKKRSKKSQDKTLLRYILYGFNYSLQKHFDEEMAKRIKRKVNRRERIMYREER